MESKPMQRVKGGGRRLGSGSRLCVAMLCGSLVSHSCAGTGATHAGSRRAASAAADLAAATQETRVRGSVLDARTHKPVAGARVEALGQTASTGPDGRFELTGLPVGRAGQLTVEAQDGRRGANRLRPLRAEPLEVVVHVKAR